MTEAKLKAGIWVKAQIRICDMACLPAVVARRGDPDSGVVLLKINRIRSGCRVLAQTRDDGGKRAWMAITGPDWVDESAAEARIRRQVDFDPDLWVLEIEDPEGRYVPDAPVI